MKKPENKFHTLKKKSNLIFLNSPWEEESEIVYSDFTRQKKKKKKKGLF